MKKLILLLSIVSLCFLCACAPSSPSSSTELPALSSEELNYIDALHNNAATVANALKEFTVLMKNPQIGNDEWTIDVAAQLVIIQFAYDEAIQMNPPESMAHIHYKYIQGMSNLNDATDLITSGIDNLDSSKIRQATNKIESGTQYIEEATALLNAFKAVHQ